MMDYSIPYIRFEAVADYLRQRICISPAVCLEVVLNQPGAGGNDEALRLWVRDALVQRWGLAMTEQLCEIEAELIEKLGAAGPITRSIDSRAVPIGAVMGLFEAARMPRAKGTPKRSTRLSAQSGRSWKPGRGRHG